MGRLGGDEVDRLGTLLMDTLSEGDLQDMVYASTGDRLYDVFVGRNMPLLRTIRDLLVELERNGLTALFLQRVYLKRPRRPDVRGAIARLFPEAAIEPQAGSADLSLQEQGRAQPGAPQQAQAPGLQRNVRPHLAQLDVQLWVAKLAQVERQVCRLEQAGSPIGSGFMVGPEAVLTNWHVVEQASKDGSLSAIECRFDYLRLPGLAQLPGMAVGLHADGCVASSPYAASDLVRDGVGVAPGELDYALLRLSRAPGDGRGWITLPTTAPALATGAPLLIMQHPLGGPMKLAMDTDAVIGRTVDGRRLRYNTNTEAGSSGSPCFTMEWELVALHHMGQLAAGGAEAFNQGIPAELVRQGLADAGAERWLGGAA